VRGWDEEGAASLHQALTLADPAGARDIAVDAHCELSYVGALAGRREQALNHLASAEELATGDAEIAAVLGIRGMQCSDAADYPQALAALEESVQRARRGDDPRQPVFSGTFLARARLLRGELAEAADLAERAMADAHESRWLAFLPFPETIRAEVDRQRDDVSAAHERFEHAFTLGCQLEDPCWEGFAARGLGLVAAARGELDEATRWLDEARTRCTRWTDRYEWAHAWLLDAAASFAIEREAANAGEMVERLEEIASRSSFRELVARALLHRARRGELDAAETARAIAARIDNPALDEVLREAPAREAHAAVNR
jgi:ATP/maltotriose-dependent transcriptional regulator MalT